MKRILLFILFTAFNFNLFSQCMLLSTSIEERVNEASIVFEGKIIKTEAFRGEKVNLIYTRYEIEVFRVFKGVISRSTLEMVSVGGTLGSETTRATPSFKGELGQAGVFMVKDYQGNSIDNSIPKLLVGVAENASVINYSPNISTAKDVFEGEFQNLEELYQLIENITNRHIIIKEINTFQRNTPLAPTISNFSPTTVTAGNKDMLTINGSGFLSSPGVVLFDNPDDGTNGSFVGASSTHIVSWSDTQIEVYVPEDAGTGIILVQDNTSAQGQSSSNLTVTYNVNESVTTLPGEGPEIRRNFLIDDGCDGDGGYKLFYSTNDSDNNGVNFVTESGGAAMASFERAIDSWQTDVGYAIFSGTDCGTTSIQTPGNDGTNIVSFDSDAWDLDDEAGSSTLGVAYSSTSSCFFVDGDGNVIPDSESEMEVVSMDIIFRRNGDPNGRDGSVNWEYGPSTPSGGESDFESVALHEIGHTHQIGHVNSPGALMHFQITNGDDNRNLGAEDIAAGNDVEAISVGYSPFDFNAGGVCGVDLDCDDRNYETYTVANDCSILGGLPIELAHFHAKLENRQTQLTWQTITEINNDFFTIEHSTDGVNFEFLTKVDGSGNTTETINYRTVHKTPSIGTNYYRLSQTDYDGTHKIEGIRAVDFKSDEIVANIQPNPVSKDFVKLNYTSPVEAEVNIEVIDITGRLLIQKNIEVQAGNNLIELPAQDLANGVYFLRTRQAQTIKSIKFVKAD